MLRLIRFLIWGDAHLHKWAPYGKVTSGYNEGDDTEGHPRRRDQAFRCDVCGKVRIFEV
jgi:hypothetical protein